MNQRIRVKRAKRVGRAMSDAFTLYTVLGNARPSFYALPAGERRNTLYDALTQPWGLRVSYRTAKRISRRWQIVAPPSSPQTRETPNG